ncbi:hypothetical protein HMPREF0080_01498 [Anaeroglobus geminatus F0357]|uniref:Endonuclease/exonuclease/phosphatase domain-containing protein n=1 Tax=Anaeroglobus geminatus F0357 TaxID=861450 RepID=G9YIK6_9FIRM|nr:hypothetical protein HMPREF0080_01498 [Anaeroglobus geminatus F0357]
MHAHLPFDKAVNLIYTTISGHIINLKSYIIIPNYTYLVKERKTAMKFISWNVNGLRAVMKKGFPEIFKELDADVFCLQETKLQEGQLSMDLPAVMNSTGIMPIKKGTAARLCLRVSNRCPPLTAWVLTNTITKAASLPSNSTTIISLPVIPPTARMNWPALITACAGKTTSAIICSPSTRKNPLSSAAISMWPTQRSI